MSITPARLYVGQVLRHFRCRAGLKQKDLGAALHVTGVLIQMAETGRRALPDRELDHADEILHADGLLRAAIPLLEADRQDRRNHGPALRRARNYLNPTKTPFLMAGLSRCRGMAGLVERLVPEELWQLFRRVVPPTEVVRPQGGGKKRADDREILAGIIFVATSGCTR
ncbi:hypothetical protein GCM10027168_06980 [Streptomyces capparidis]